MINLDDEVYRKAKEVIEQKTIEYPNLKNFVDKAVLEKIKKEVK